MKYSRNFLQPRSIALAAVSLFILIQLVPVWAFQTNPALRVEPNWPNPEVRAIAKRACFDCHSNETAWPLYTKIAPASWLVTSDVLRGRRELNFSAWNASDEQDDIVVVIEKGEMPPRIYTLLHPDAVLSDADRQALISAFQFEATAPLNTSEQPSQPAAPPEAAHISAQQAAQIALAYHRQSEVREVKLEKERGVVAYEVRFVDGSEVYIAAATGQVVYAQIERDGDE